ncbi:hypothetical protein ACFLY9_00140 [Patescibacteria group bacterium]
MAIYKQSIDFTPRLSKGEVKEKYKVSKAGVYSAILPLLTSIIWVIAMLINSYYKNEVRSIESTILSKNSEIESYSSVRSEYTELVLKVDALSDLVVKDFYPQRFFNNVTSTIRSTNDAQAEIYSYGRDDDGTFNISGRANSYLDLAKIMVAFNSKEEFSGVEVKSIRYDRELDNVNFEINFIYAEEVSSEQ